MSEYHFGCGKGRVLNGAAIDTIAREHDAHFIWGDFPGDGPRYWFATRDYGHPFAGATARAVSAAVDAAGGISVRIFRDGRWQTERRYLLPREEG